jgi:hypothetical protein
LCNSFAGFGNSGLHCRNAKQKRSQLCLTPIVTVFTLLKKMRTPKKLYTKE